MVKRREKKNISGALVSLLFGVNFVNWNFWMCVGLADLIESFT